MHIISRTLSIVGLMFFLVCTFGCGGASEEKRGLVPNEGTKPVNGKAKGGGALGDPLLVEADLRFEPPHMEVRGVSQCQGDQVETVTLVNFGDSPEVIRQVITSCGCARLQIPAGTTIPAGASLTLPVRMKPWGGKKRKAHEARVVMDDGRLGPILTLDVENVSPLRSIPSACQRALHPEGKIRILTEDGESVSLVGFEPEIPITTLETEGAEITLFVEWDALDTWVQSPAGQASPNVRFDDQGEWDVIDLNIRTDHPSCPQLHVELLNRGYTKPVWK